MRHASLLLVVVLVLVAACKGDRRKCEVACRNYAKLTYWKMAEVEIAALPADKQASARKHKENDFANQLETGVDVCINQCVSANNDDQIECMTEAKTADVAIACSQSDDE